MRPVRKTGPHAGYQQRATLRGDDDLVLVHSGVADLAFSWSQYALEFVLSFQGEAWRAICSCGIVAAICTIMEEFCLADISAAS
mmetsp:Transcript_15582/g.34194  ORF Transcript_15582/g.34194 Transcript_15582/m.34194 type:complete len:84 (+) Transcript_15582:78-329(+)